MMILVWNDAKSFKRHIEAMKLFRQSHDGDLEEWPGLFRDMPAAFDVGTSLRERPFKGFTAGKGKVVVVPIWKIDMPADARN